MTYFSTRKKIGVGYIVALCIVGFFITYTYWGLRSVGKDSVLVNKALQSHSYLNSLLDNLQKVDRYQYEYRLSNSKENANSSLKKAIELVRSDSALIAQQEVAVKQKNDIAKLLSISSERILIANNTINGQNSYDVLLAGHLTDEAKALVKNIETTDRLAIVAVSEEAKTTYRKTNVLFIILSVLFILFLISFLFIILRSVWGQELSNENAENADKKFIALRDIVDRVRGSFIALDRDWRIIYVNADAEELFQDKGDVLIGKDFWDSFKSVAATEIKKEAKSGFDAQMYTVHECLIPEVDRWCKVHVHPSLNGISLYFEDITEVKQNDSKLKLLADRLNVVAFATDDVLWESDFVNGKLWWNANFYKKFGYSDKENPVLANSWENLIHPMDKERVLSHLNSTLKDTESIVWTAEYKFAKADGSYLDIFDRCYIFRNENGDATKLIGSMADVTQVFETQRKLALTDEKYKALVNSIDGVVWEADAKTCQITFIGKQVERLLGYPVKDWYEITDFFFKQIHEVDREWATKYYLNKRKEKNPFQFEFRMVAKDGQTVWFRNVVTPVFENDEAVLVRGILIDISEKGRAVLELQRAKELADKLIDSMPGIFYFADEEGYLILWNKQLELASGYEANQLGKMTPEELFEKAADAEYKNNQEKQQGFAVGSFEANLIVRDDHRVPYYLKVIEIDYEGRNCFLGTGVDITERKRSEELIKTSEKKYKLLFERNPLAMWMASVSGHKIIDVNEAALWLYGYTKDEFMKLSPLDLNTVSKLAENGEEHKAEIFNEPRYVGIWHHKKKDRSQLHIEVVVHDVYYENRYVRLVMANNITDKYIAEEKLKTSYNSIRELTSHIQNIREVERAAIAKEIHDELGQRLTVVKMNTAWIKKRVNDQESEIKEKLLDNEEMLNNMVQTVRRISSELRPRMLDDLGLNAAIEWQLNEFEQRYGTKTQFVDAHGDEDILPENIKTGIFRILQESLSNVARHAEAKRVVVELGYEPNRLILTIEDDGLGFDENKISDKSKLGILSMQERVARMGGTYQIQNKKTGGVVVKVGVPVTTNS